MNTKDFAISENSQVTVLVLTFNDEGRVTGYNVVKDAEEVDSVEEIAEFLSYAGLTTAFPNDFITVDTPLESDMYDGKDYVEHIVYKPTMQAIGVSGYYTSYEGPNPQNKMIADVGEKTINILNSVTRID